MSTSFDNNIKQKYNLDLYNIEAHSLIDLSFNFDFLKSIITELINNQKNINNEISKIKSDLLKQQENKINLESYLLELKNSKQPSQINQKNFEEVKREINIEFKESENKDNKENKENNNNNNENNNNNDNILVKEIINEKKSKINNSFLNIEKNVNTENNNIQKIETDNSLENLKIKKENIIKENKPINIVKEIKIINQEKALVTQPIIPEEIYTAINDIKDIKSKQINLEKDLIEHKKDVEKKIQKKISDSIPDIEDSFNSKIKILEKRITEKMTKNTNNMKEEYDKKNKDTQEKLSKAEITNKLVLELREEANSLIAKVDTLNNNFSFYTKLDDFNKYKSETLEYFKNNREEINRNIELVRRGFNNVKNQFIDHMNDRTDHNRLENLLTQFENAQSLLNDLQDFKNEMEEKEKKRIVIDPNRYINKDLFNDFLKNEHKNFEENKKELLTLKNDLEELKTKEFGNKATLKDLKSLEDDISKRIEELKQSISNHFVDKITLDKDKKIIEMRTKKLIEKNKKKVINEELKENWLLSKKPFSGHLCASCESFIGELNPNVTDKYIPWNQYPKKEKETQNKVYKIEGGISNFINMFNTHLKNNEYDKSNINCTSLNNSTNIMKTNNEDNESFPPNNSKKNDNENVNNNKKNKRTQTNGKNSFSSKLSRKKFKIKSNIDEIENLNNFPMIPGSIKNFQSNNKSFNFFNSDNEGKQKIKNMDVFKMLKSNNSSIFYKKIKKDLKNEEDFYLSSRKNNASNDEINKEPIITRIIKKTSK